MSGGHTGETTDSLLAAVAAGILIGPTLLVATGRARQERCPAGRGRHPEHSVRPQWETSSKQRSGSQNTASAATRRGEHRTPWCLRVTRATHPHAAVIACRGSPWGTLAKLAHAGQSLFWPCVAYERHRRTNPAQDPGLLSPARPCPSSSTPDPPSSSLRRFRPSPSRLLPAPNSAPSPSTHPSATHPLHCRFEGRPSPRIWMARSQVR